MKTILLGVRKSSGNTDLWIKDVKGKMVKVLKDSKKVGVKYE